MMDLTLTPNAEVSTLPGIKAADFNVMHGELRVGRLRREATLSPAAQWIWVVSVYDGPDAMRRSGAAGTVEEAQAALNDSWQLWLAWAGLSTALQESPSVAADLGDDDPLAAALREAFRAARG
jgi:predicted RNase H-like HicB family nuclease